MFFNFLFSGISFGGGIYQRNHYPEYKSVILLDPSYNFMGKNTKEVVKENNLRAYIIDETIEITSFALDFQKEKVQFWKNYRIKAFCTSLLFSLIGSYSYKNVPRFFSLPFIILSLSLSIFRFYQTLSQVQAWSSSTLKTIQTSREEIGKIQKEKVFPYIFQNKTPNDAVLHSIETENFWLLWMLKFYDSFSVSFDSLPKEVQEQKIKDFFSTNPFDLDVLKYAFKEKKVPEYWGKFVNGYNSLKELYEANLNRFKKMREQLECTKKECINHLQTYEKNNFDHLKKEYENACQKLRTAGSVDKKLEGQLEKFEFIFQYKKYHVLQQKEYCIVNLKEIYKNQIEIINKIKLKSVLDFKTDVEKFLEAFKENTPPKIYEFPVIKNEYNSFNVEAYQPAYEKNEYFTKEDFDLYNSFCLSSP